MRIIKVQIIDETELIIELEKKTVELDSIYEITTLGFSDTIEAELHMRILNAININIDSFTMKY